MTGRTRSRVDAARGDLSSGIWRWVLLLGAIQAALCLYYARFALIDDAFIAMRYAVNFVQGRGLVFNLGEHVEGYTCFLWVLALAVPAALGLDMVIASRLLGALFLLLTLVVTARFFLPNPKRPVWSVLIAPALFATNAAVAMWAVHGLETSMFTLLVTVALWADARDHGDERFKAGWSAVWYALATLTRPEGAWLFGASALYWAVSRPRRLLNGAIWRHGLQYTAIVVPYWLWRFHYYGYPLPNTFYTKVSLSLPLVLRGVAYVLDFFGGLGAPLFLALLLALLVARRERRIAFLGWVLVAYFLMVCLEGGDAFPAYRFIVPICPILYLLVQEGFYAIVVWGHGKSPARVLARAVTALVLAAAPFHAWRMMKSSRSEAEGADQFTTNMTLAGLCLKRHLPSTTRIAVNPAGAVPFYSGLYTYDMLGLTNEHIAHVQVQMGAGFAGHEKGDGRYILDEAPDIILYGNVQIAPSNRIDLGRVRWRATLRSEKEIAEDPRVTRLYVPDMLPLGDGRYLLFLRRKDFRIPKRQAQSESFSFMSNCTVTPWSLGSESAHFVIKSGSLRGSPPFH